jgi:hypothetical protein
VRGIAFEHQGAEHIAAADYADHKGLLIPAFDDGKTTQSRREHAIYGGSNLVIGRQRHDTTSHDVVDVFGPQDTQFGEKALGVMTEDSQEIELGDDAEQGMRLIDHRKGVETVDGERCCRVRTDVFGPTVLGRGVMTSRIISGAMCLVIEQSPPPEGSDAIQLTPR